MSTTMKVKIITRFAELKFIERLKYLIDDLIYHTVDYHRDTKSTLLTVRFGYLYPKERIRLYVPSRMDPTSPEPYSLR